MPTVRFQFTTLEQKRSKAAGVVARAWRSHRARMIYREVKLLKEQERLLAEQRDRNIQEAEVRSETLHKVCPCFPPLIVAAGVC